MAQKLRILIAGDLFMKPRVFQDVLGPALTAAGYETDIRLLEYPYPVEEFCLTDDTLPHQSGGAWDKPVNHLRFQDQSQEVSEYYGPLDSLCRKVVNEDILVVHLAPITRAVLAQTKELKLIACCRGGPKNINLAAATEQGIPVIYAPGRNSVAVAEYTVGLLLAHVRYIARGHSNLGQGIWKVGAYRDKHLGPELRGSTAGIIGLGNIGREIVTILNGFQMRLCAYDPYLDDSVYRRLGVKNVSLETLLQESDFIILAARLTPESTKLIGSKELALMKPTAYLVNTARGGLVDYEALRQALQAGRIAGAALDVFGTEPLLRSDPLRQVPNVTLTPHIAGASRNVIQNAARILTADILRFLKKEPLQHCLNPESLSQI